MPPLAAAALTVISILSVTTVQCRNTRAHVARRLVVIGFAAGAIIGGGRQTTCCSSPSRSAAARSVITPAARRRHGPFAKIFALFEAGDIRPAAAQQFPLERAGEALAGLRDRRIVGRGVRRLRPINNEK
jgi:NADPH:quinone reductase-like Zn-dependent oxidoreductase